MVFKQSFKYLKNEKIKLSKVILKLECLFYPEKKKPANYDT